MTQSKGPDWMGVLQVAEALGVSPRDVYRLIDQGALPAYRLGRVIRVRRSDFEAVLGRAETDDPPT